MPVSATSFRTSVTIPDYITLTSADLSGVVTAIKAANVTHVVLPVSWSDFQAVKPTTATPSSLPTSDALTALDRVIGLVSAASMKATLVLTGPLPSWVTSVTPAQFSVFAGLVAKKYAKNTAVVEYQIWDAPNAAVSWLDAPNAADYTAVLQGCYSVIKSANPALKVIFGGLQAVVSQDSRVASTRQGRLSGIRATATTTARTTPLRHKLFTWSGTMVPDRLFYQAMVGQGVDSSLWEWVPVYYPHWLPVNTSVADGVKNGIAAIRAWPGKFAFSGYSQGAIVASNLLWELKFGSLKDRYQDLIGGVMFGNPCREANVTFPGGINPGGSGMAPDNNKPTGRIRNTPSWWYDFANSPLIPGVLGTDNFAVNPLTSAGIDITAVYQMMLGEFTGASYDIFERTRQLLNSTTRANAIRDAVLSIGATIEGSFAGHAEYSWSRPLAGSNLTSVQLGIRHLNTVGAATRVLTSATFSEVNPVEFLNAAYTAGAKNYFDTLAYSPLSRQTPLMSKPPEPSGDLIQQADNLRNVMVAKGDSAKKVLWTVGYDTDTDTGKFSQRQQALYLDTLRWFAEKRKDHVSGLNVHTFRDQI